MDHRSHISEPIPLSRFPFLPLPRETHKSAVSAISRAARSRRAAARVDNTRGGRGEGSFSAETETAAMASASPHRSVSPSPSSASPLQFSSVAEANSYRLKAIVERLNFICRGGIRFDAGEFSSLCIALARGVDYALTINNVPGVAPRLPSLIRLAYQRRNDTLLQPALMLLTICAKNACNSGWFQPADADELLRMTNELLSSFCLSGSVPTGVVNPLDVIPKIMPKFYPQLKFTSLIVSLEAKPGYEVLLADFQIPRNLPPEEKIRLIVVQTDNLETSSCIISPPQVSFLVNGKGVERRTNVSLDTGPQFPTDITKMLKYGTNIIQAIGLFKGTYLIALAFMSKQSAINAPILEDYVQPVAVPTDADSEIIEGASRISLNCPISFRLIKTPVKGHFCKHHQCFDYDNFMEMNSRKPSWRCPFCNQPVSYIDVRIDRNMVKILEEVGEGVSDVVISADGSWKAVVEHNGKKDQLNRGEQAGQPDFNIECASNRFTDSMADAVDLTAEDETSSLREMEPLTEDIKPFMNTHDVFDSQYLTESPLPNQAFVNTTLPNSESGHGIWSRNLSNSVPSGSLASTRLDTPADGTTESLFPVLVNPVITDAVSPALNREPLVALEASRSAFSYDQLSQVRQLVENMQLQPPHVGSSLVSMDAGRPAIPRHVNRTPVAVQALPVQAQPSNSFKRMRINGPNSSPLFSNDSSTTPQTVQPLTAIPGGLGVASGNMELQQFLKTPNLPVAQDNYQQNHKHVPSPVLQQVALPTSNPISTRVASTQPRGTGAYRALHTPFGTQDTRRHLSDLRLALGASRELSGQRTAQQTVRMQGGVTATHASRLAPPVMATAPSPRLSSTEQQHNMTEIPSEQNWRSMTELPPEQNWRPTGRMRGSLTGSAYSAALNHYLTPQTQTPPVKLPDSGVPSTSGLLPELNVNAIGAHRHVTQQANSRHGNVSSQHFNSQG